MVVMVVMAIMAAMIIPEMKGTYEDALLRSASRELIGVFSLASSRAISLNQLLRVHLDPSTGRYAMERKVNHGPDAGAFAPVRDVPDGQGKLDARISIEIRKPSEDQSPAETSQTAPWDAPEKEGLQDQDQAIAFYPDGTAEAGEVLLRDRAGFRLVLRINPITARVRVLELDRP